MNRKTKEKTRQEQAEETKERIRRVALELFSTKDYGTVTVSMICRAAHVSNGLLYNYFPSKESILLDEFYKADQRYLEIERSFYKGQPAKERMLLLMQAIWGSVCHSGILSQRAIRVAYINILKNGVSEALSLDRPVWAITRNIIHYAKERGELRAGYSSFDASLLFTILSIGFVSTSLWDIVQKDVDGYEKEFFHVIDLALDGVFQNPDGL